MTELNLIPEDYRNRLSQRTMFRRYVIAFAILNIVILVSTVVLGQFSKQATARVQELQSQSAITEQQQAQLKQLKLEQTEYERRWSLLRGLRAGAAVEDIFKIIDGAMGGNDLWFGSWKFRRAGVVIDGETRAVETGYFLIVPAEQRTDANTEWKVETHMTLQGHARDHQALSTFLRALFEQPDIKDINVRKTSLIDYANGRVVSFEMTIVLNSAFVRL